jgi:hypothetical protein
MTAANELKLKQKVLREMCQSPLGGII